MAALMLQASPSFHSKNSKTASFFPQIHMEDTMFVKSTASPINMTKRVLYTHF